ncbi:unnamed protein product [Heligmosomoides polygyrus]|uniref:Uncharacterized protein n=1 Tax=Heligmosomoides polygyrus TaxID=6339 RepID=A0A183GBR7_HELPZ|nr:unnamed protein product [Heligmosomoides polygyrus]
MTNACGLIKASEAEVNRLDQPFAFPEERKDCEEYIREKTAQLNHLMRTNKVDFKKDELSQQAILIASCQETASCEQPATGNSGNNYESAGEAAASITYVPVIGDKYYGAVNILKKQYDRSASIADILINEIEKIPRAHDTPRSCRDTLSAITSRIIHLEQTGVSLNADRVWRRMILSKFTEHICSTVIRKETVAGISFEVKDIREAIDEIITLQETTELTTATLFGTYPHDTDNDRFSRQNESQQIELCSHWRTLPLCLGEVHPPQYCTAFSTPEERRNEVIGKTNHQQ